MISNTKNLFNYKIPKKDEKFTTLFEHKNIKIIRIVSAENFTPIKYRQKEDEWVILIEGEAVIRVNKEEKTLKKGDSLFIPAQTPHQVLKMSEGTVWLTVHIN